MSSEVILLVGFTLSADDNHSPSFLTLRPLQLQMHTVQAGLRVCVEPPSYIYSQEDTFSRAMGIRWFISIPQMVLAYIQTKSA